MQFRFPWQAPHRSIREHVFLRPGALLSVQGLRGLCIEPGRAELWITRLGDVNDYVATPGRVFRLGHRSHYCVTAFAPTLVTLRGEVQASTGWHIERIQPEGVRVRIAPLPRLARLGERMAERVDALRALFSGLGRVG